MRPSSRVALVLSAAVIAAATACSSGDTPTDSDRALRVAVAVDASSLDPIMGNSGSDHVMLYAMYDTLISFDENLAPQPGLAESWEQKSPTELTLRLRDGVTFHDGTVFDAEAVRYNIDRARGENSNVALDLGSVAGVRVDDKSTVTFELTEPDAALPMVLADRAGMMVSPAAAEANGGDLSRAPVGTGAWSFAEWRPGQHLSVEQYDNYWDTSSPRAESIRFSIIPDPTTRAMSIRSGQQDVALEIATANAAALESAAGVELRQSPRLQLTQVYLNRAAAELDDPKVRRALNLAIDRSAIVAGAFLDRAQPSSAMTPQQYWAAPPESVDYPHDPEAARKLLAEADATGMSFDMLVNADTATIRVAEILQAQWAEVGVTVQLLPREAVQATTDYFSDRKAPALLSVYTGRPDPAMGYGLLFQADSYYNTSRESTPGIEQALDRTDVSLELNERRAGFDAAAEAVYLDASFIPIAFADSLIGIRSDVQGLATNLLGKPKFIGAFFG